MRPEPEQSLHPQGAPVATPATVDVLGVPLALTDYDEMLGWIDAMVAERWRGYVCACNVHTVMASREDPDLRAALLSPYALNVPDGQPLVWAINALGHSLTDRVYGPELMARACARAAVTEQRLYLYGGQDQEALLKLGLSLRQRFPGINIVSDCPINWSCSCPKIFSVARLAKRIVLFSSIVMMASEAACFRFKSV